MTNITLFSSATSLGIWGLVATNYSWTSVRGERAPAWRSDLIRAPKAGELTSGQTVIAYIALKDLRNLRIPSGNERGAWDGLWIPSGYSGRGGWTFRPTFLPLPSPWTGHVKLVFGKNAR